MIIVGMVKRMASLVVAIVWAGSCSSSSTNESTGGSGGSGANDASASDAGQGNDTDGGQSDGDAAQFPGPTEDNCAPPPPVGWTGPTILLTGAFSCDDAWKSTTTAFSGQLIFEPASCAKCTCDTPAGISCSLPKADLYDQIGTCTGSLVETLSPTASGECKPVTQGFPDKSGRATASTASVGSCKPAGGDATLDTPHFAETFTICSELATAKACESSGSVVPVPKDGTICITKTGDNSCPSSDFTVKTLAYLDLDDTRSCSACGCGASTAVQCGGTFSLFNSPDCTSLAQTLPADGTTCKNVGDPTSYKYVQTGPTGGNCPANGGKAQGSVLPKEPLTICCMSSGV